MKMTVEYSWIDTDKGKTERSEKNLYQVHFVHLKSHTDWPEFETGPLRLEAGEYRPE
jgi:hypothetical protein